MADIAAPTSTQVVPDSDAIIDRTRTAGEAIDAGHVVYLDANALYVAKKALHTAAGGAASSMAYGIATSTAGVAGQTIGICTAGKVDLGAALGVAAGTFLFVGENAGRMTATTGDVGAGEYSSFVGVGVGSNKVKVGCLNSGVAHA